MFIYLCSPLLTTFEIDYFNICGLEYVNQRSSYAASIDDKKLLFHLKERIKLSMKSCWSFLIILKYFDGKE